MSKTRWTLRDMLIAVAWICAGLAALRFVWLQASPRAIDSFGLRVLAHLFGGVALGAGVGTLFKHPRQYALIGLFIALGLLCVVGAIGLFRAR